MSADNTILLIRFSNKKWRMKQVFAVENLYFSHRNLSSLNPNPVRLYEMMCDAKSYKSKHLAYDDAEKIFEEGYVEYGIQPIKVDYNWEELMSLAYGEIVKEIDFLLEDTERNYSVDDYSLVEELIETREELEKKINERK